MNDFRDLKAIAEVCQQHQPLRFMRSHGALYIRNDNGIVFDVHQNRSFPELMAQNKDYADLALAANPATVLALFAENAALVEKYEAARDRKNSITALKIENEALRKEAERLHKATAFVQRLCDVAGKQPSIATGYLRDILSAMSKGEQS